MSRKKLSFDEFIDNIEELEMCVKDTFKTLKPLEQKLVDVYTTREKHQCESEHHRIEKMANIINTINNNVKIYKEIIDDLNTYNY